MASVGEAMGVKETITAIKERQSERYPASWIISDEISKRLSSGLITKAEAKEVNRFFDEDMQFALSTRYGIQDRIRAYDEYGTDHLVEGSYITDDNKKLKKIFSGTGLSMRDIYEAAKLADDDCKIQRMRLSKTEKEAGKRGEITRSELHNIQNFLNAKIKEHGGTKELSEKETIKIMEYIVGLKDDTRKLNPLKFVASFIVLAPIWASIVELATPYEDFSWNLVSSTKQEIGRAHV